MFDLADKWLSSRLNEVKASLLSTSDASDDMLGVNLGVLPIIIKKTYTHLTLETHRRVYTYLFILPLQPYI